MRDKKGDKAKGIAFQSKFDADGGEEIDLNAFDNEAIHVLEEAKIEP